MPFQASGKTHYDGIWTILECSHASDMQSVRGFTKKCRKPYAVSLQLDRLPNAVLLSVLAPDSYDP